MREEVTAEAATAAMGPDRDLPMEATTVRRLTFLALTADSFGTGGRRIVFRIPMRPTGLLTAIRQPSNHQSKRIRPSITPSVT